MYKIRSNKPDSFNYTAFSLASLKGEKKAKAICYLKTNTGDEYSESYYKPKDENDDTLVFESRFECGNLAMASKVIYFVLLLRDSQFLEGRIFLSKFLIE